MIKPLPCPFCGKPPVVYPLNPEIEGDAFAYVICETKRCVANPRVADGALSCDSRGSDKYKAAAIRRWNKRYESKAEDR
jgi:hypothetical protein